jgi:thiamine-phosphate pyrophosphorylase
MLRRHPLSQIRPLPQIWIVSDARNDAALDRALAGLPRGCGLIFRHYHLGPAERRGRFGQLARIARARGHLVILAGTRAQARRWGADGAYGPGGDLVPVHSLREIGRAKASALLLSPVFATRSHPGEPALGPLRFRLLARRARAPVIALGGMDAHRARRLKWPFWAGIDAFCGEANPWNLVDS